MDGNPGPGAGGQRPTALDIAKQVLSTSLFVPIDKIDDDAEITAIKPLDSLAFEVLVLELEERIGADIDPLEFIGLRTVADLARIIDRTK